MIDGTTKKEIDINMIKIELLRNNFRSTTVYLTATFVLGVIFIISKFINIIIICYIIGTCNNV